MLEMKNKIEIEEEKSIKDCSVFIRNINLNTESYETKLLLEENIENVMKLQITYEGENAVLRYDVSNTISLEEYLKTNKLKKKEICFIIDAIDGILSSIENYLISENSIPLDLKLIRLERERKKINLKFVIIPNYNSDFSYELSKFLIRILRFVDINDNDALTLAYGLFIKSSKDNYTINDLLELVDEVRDKKKAFDNFDLESLSKYDDEMASNMVEPEEMVIPASDAYNFMEEPDESKFHKKNEKKEKPIENVISSENNIEEQMKIDMDIHTRNLIEDELFDNFDKAPNKIIGFGKSIFNIKDKKALNAHIDTSFIDKLFMRVCSKLAKGDKR